MCDLITDKGAADGKGDGFVYKKKKNVVSVIQVWEVTRFKNANCVCHPTSYNL